MHGDQPGLTLVCDATRGSYNLSRGAAASWIHFSSLAAAFDHAATLVTEETRLTVYNEDGIIIMDTTILPKAAEQTEV